MMRIRKWVSILTACTFVLGMGLQANASSISEVQKEGQELESQKSAAETEKAELAEQLNALITEMEETTAAIEVKHEEIAEKETELMQAELEEQNQYDSMKMRIKYMYENGNTQFVEILFESESIGDFLNNAEYITQISQYDRDMLEEFQETVETVKEGKEALEEEKAELEELQSDLEAKETELNTLIEEKSSEISSLEAAIGENAQKLQELQAEAERQQQIQNEQNNSGSNSSSQGPSIPPSGSGVLINPCPSGWVSSYFGGRESPGGIGSTNHKGQDFAADPGEPIYAAASGTVTTVSYSAARGYYVLINHGNGLSTLYQHCSAVYVSAGQYVSVGTNIAAVGSTGYSTGPHLHFEVWENGVPVDPRYYL